MWFYNWSCLIKSFFFFFFFFFEGPWDKISTAKHSTILGSRMSFRLFTYKKPVNWARKMSAWYTVHEYVYSGIVYQYKQHRKCLRYNKSPYSKDWCNITQHVIKWSNWKKQYRFGNNHHQDNEHFVVGCCPIDQSYNHRWHKPNSACGCAKSFSQGSLPLPPTSPPPHKPCYWFIRLIWLK